MPAASTVGISFLVEVPHGAASIVVMVITIAAVAWVLWAGRPRKSKTPG